MSYPKDWEKLERQFGTDIMFRAPHNAAFPDFSPTVNITAQDLRKSPEMAELKQFMAFSIPQINEIIEDFIIEQGRDAFMDGVAARDLLYTGIREGFSLKVLQRSAVKEDHAFVFTYVATIDQYELHENNAREMLESFRFL